VQSQQLQYSLQNDHGVDINNYITEEVYRKDNSHETNFGYKKMETLLFLLYTKNSIKAII
jgi:hypothetical protein